MIHIRRSLERGYENKGWLQTYHTFSFDTYYDPQFLGYHSVRVINEEILQGGKGYGAHFHKEIELITYVLEGILEYQDNAGRTGVIRPGEVQLLSAGTGITHNEYNLSQHLPVHFIQIWVEPEQFGGEATYAQKLFSSAAKWGQWRLLISNNGREGSLRVHQDFDLYTTLLEEKEVIAFPALEDRYYWVQVISGKFFVQDLLLEAGDGASLINESTIEFKCIEGGELLFLDQA